MDCEASSKLNILERMVRDESIGPTNLPLSLLKEVTNNFSDDRLIGRGGFAVVYKGLLGNGGTVAVKKLDDMICMDEEKYKQEVHCLMRVRHKNIVRFLGYCADTQGKYMEHEGKPIMADLQHRLLCFEYLPEGNLDDYTKDTSHRMEWRTHYKILKGICEGLCYLHENHIVHLDLKPANILLDDNMVPKISDFGISRCFDEKQSRDVTLNLRGTLGYLAPESYSGVITFKSDIYSMGVIFTEILTGQKGYSPVDKVLQNWRNRFGISSTDELLEQVRVCAEISKACLDFDPEQRPDIQSIIQKLNERERTQQYIELGMNSTLMVQVSEDTDIRLQETNASNELLEFHPPMIQFHFEPNKLITCPLNLINRTYQRVGFMIYPYNRGMYFTEWLCGVVPPRSTYTLTVTMKEQQQPPPEGKFLIKYSSVTSEQLMNTSQREPYKVFKDFFTKVEKMGLEMVHQRMLIVVCDPQATTTSEAISTKEFDTLYSMDVHSTKPWIVTGHAKGQVCIWDYQTKEKVNFFEATKDEEGISSDYLIFTVKFISREDWIVAGGGDYDAYIYVYSCNTWEIVKKFKAHNNQLTSFAIHPTEPYLLSASYGNKIKLWDWGTGWNNEPKLKFEGHMGSVTQVVFNPEEAKDYASASKDGTIKIWNVDSTVANFTSPECKSQVRCLDYFSRGDGQYLITGLDDGTAQIWNLQKKERVEILKGHTARISAVCPHPDRAILLTGSHDGTVRLWNSNTFRLQGILNFAMRKVYELACMKNDTRRIVIGHSNGLAIFRIDDLDDSSETRATC